MGWVLFGVAVVILLAAPWCAADTRDGRDWHTVMTPPLRLGHRPAAVSPVGLAGRRRLARLAARVARRRARDRRRRLARPGPRRPPWRPAPAGAGGGPECVS